MAPLVDGRYELIEVIGSGGMATVWRARDVRLERQVALKRPYRPDPRFGQLSQEARVAAAISHPHLVSVHDAGEDADGPYLIMELVEAPSLAQVGASLSADRIVETGMQISRALAAVHRAGVVHQDVKPGNILMAEGGAKLTDFGIASTRANQQPPAAVLATADYAAPEVLAGHPPVDRSDVYSLAVVLRELLAAPLPDGRRRSLPGPIGQLLDQCLAQSPTDRPSATMVAAELNGILADMRAAAPPGAPIASVAAPPVAAPMPAASTTMAMPRSAAVGTNVAAASAFGAAPTSPPVGGHDPTATQVMGSRPPMAINPINPGGLSSTEPPGPPSPPSKAWIGPAVFGVVALVAVITVIALLSDVLDRPADDDQQALVVEEPDTSVTVPSTSTTVEETTTTEAEEPVGEADTEDSEDGGDDDDDGGLGFGLGGLIDRLESVDDFVDDMTDRANEIDATAKEIRDVMKKVQEATEKAEEGKPAEAAKKLEEAADKVGDRLDGDARQQLLDFLDDVAEELDLPDLELAERFGDGSEGD